MARRFGRILFSFDLFHYADRQLLGIVDTFQDQLNVHHRLPRFQRAPDPRVTLARVNAYNEAIAQEARDVKASVVDLFVQPVREELIFDVDGFHPNDAGHREIARLFLQAIFAKLGVK